MQYRSSTGDAELCGRLAALLRGRGCAAEAADIIVCSGAQQAADIVATVLLDERSVVASESPTYWGSLGVFDARGVTYVEVRGDEDGVRSRRRRARLCRVPSAAFLRESDRAESDRRRAAGAAREADRRAGAALRRRGARGSDGLAAHLRCARPAAAGRLRYRRPRHRDGESLEVDLSRRCGSAISTRRAASPKRSRPRRFAPTSSPRR